MENPDLCAALSSYYQREKTGERPIQGSIPTKQHGTKSKRPKQGRGNDKIYLLLVFFRRKFIFNVSCFQAVLPGLGPRFRPGGLNEYLYFLKYLGFVGVAICRLLSEAFSSRKLARFSAEQFRVVIRFSSQDGLFGCAHFLRFGRYYSIVV